ncbi:DUF1214 domain-containing protein [Oerskovia sp. M15]
MCMRLTGIGSQYIFATRDSHGDYLDGERTYRITLPQDIPQSRFWSVMAYDRQTRSMLQTDQAMPDLGSQSGTVQANPDGSTDIYFGPTARRARSRTGCRPFPGRAGSRSSACTTRSNHSSTRSGAPPRSSRSDERLAHRYGTTGG